MPDTKTNAPRPPGRRNFLVRAAIVSALALMVLLSPCVWDVGRHVGNWKLAIARQQYDRRQTEQAIETSEAALRWDANNASILQYQIELYTQQGDLEAALAKAAQWVEAAPPNSRERLQSLETRSDLLQRTGRHQEAIADANAMVELAKELSRYPPAVDMSSVLNTRAYVVARAAAAGAATDQQKGAALEEMRILLRLRPRRDPLDGESVHARMQNWLTELAYLDTFAYLRLYSGDPAGALRDLNRCVELCEFLLSLWQSYAGDHLELAGLGRIDLALRRHQAVILHHRGEALLALKNEAAARRDFALARQLGFDPKKGPW